jgi:tRNA pseudouridine55 synthase
MTSHDVVAKVRRLVGERRVGHAGTLDPMATGLLVVAVGPSTRLLRFAQGQTKVYTGRVRLGEGTDSLDADGAIVATAPVPTLDVASMNAAAHAFTGAQQQIPPMVSALKVNGRRLHELAREGVEVERAPRAITIDRFHLEATDDPRDWEFEVQCSVGTYVRVLLADLALSLGTVGHLTALRREASGHHHVQTALTLEALTDQRETGSVALLPPLEFVSHLTQVTLDEQDLTRLERGQRLTFDAVEATAEVAVLDTSGRLAGIVHRRDEGWQPDIVFLQERN